MKSNLKIRYGLILDLLNMYEYVINCLRPFSFVYTIDKKIQFILKTTVTFPLITLFILT